MPGGEAKPSGADFWSGWQAYDTHTPQLTQRLLGGARRLVDRKGVVRDLRSMLPHGAQGQPKAALKLIVRSVVGQRASRGSLGRPLVDAYKTGWAEGAHAAGKAVDALTATKDDHPGRNPGAAAAPAFYSPNSPGGGLPPLVSTHVDWTHWAPGSQLQADAAQSLPDLIEAAVGADDGWQTRASARGSLLASIEDTRLDKLADAISQALADGTSVDELTPVIEGVLDDPAWAGMVAHTELARAMTAASYATYRSAGIPAVTWYGADDDRECVLCGENEDAAPIPIGSDWPNGSPPVHPRCRCALGPAWIDQPTDDEISDVISGTGDASDEG